jgi:MFS family permease
MKKIKTNYTRNGYEIDKSKEATDKFSPRTGRWVLFATVLASSMAFINQSSLNVALPALQSALGATGPELLWIINGYNLMIASFLLVGGTLGDRFGRKKIFSESFGEGASKKIDLAGAGLATLSLVGIAYGFTSAPEFGFSDSRVLISLCSGGVLLIAFIVVEKMSSHPMMSLTIFKSRSFSGANLLTLFLYGALAAYSLFLSLNFIQIQGYRETIAGVVFLPFIVLLAGMSRWSGKLVDKIGPRLPLIAGPSIVGAGFLLTGFAGLTEGPPDYWTKFLPGIFLFGVGMGLTVAPLTTTVMSSVSDKLAGAASGINNAASRVAGVLAIAILGSIALISFSHSALNHISDIDLTPEVQSKLEVEISKFGDAGVPESVPDEFFTEVDVSLKYAFVDTFRLLMYICAAMAWVSAAIAATLVKRRLEPD